MSVVAIVVPILVGVILTVVLAVAIVATLLLLCLRRGKRITSPVINPLDKGKVYCCHIYKLYTTSHVHWNLSIIKDILFQCTKLVQNYL